MPIYFNNKVTLLALVSLLLLLVLHELLYGEAGTGTSAQYGPPYLPTTCYGNDASQFPSTSFFAAAGNELWDNGAACGRQYRVKCVGGTSCTGQVIQVTIVDYVMTSVSRPSHEGSTMVLSDTAFTRVNTNSTADFIHIEFQRQCFISKKWILSLFHKASWTFKLEQEAEYEGMFELKDFKVKRENGTRCFQLKIRVEILILQVKFMLPDFCSV